jgi:DNA-binding CsgD family transcriptional regulator
MERLRERDVRSLLDFLTGCYAAEDLDAFARHVAERLPDLVPNDAATYNEINPRTRRADWVVEPAALDFPGSRQAFERHMGEHPFVSYFRRTCDGSAIKLSDFLTRRQLHDLGLYQEFYRHVRGEYLMAINLPVAPPVIIGIAAIRARRDFTERERLIFDLIRPHASQAYRNAEVATLRRQELALLRQGVEELGHGLVTLGRDGRIVLATTRARQWLTEYFGVSRGPANRLPEAMERWVQHTTTLRLAQARLACPPRPLVVERGGKRLTVRLLSGSACRLLLLGEQQTTAVPAAFDSLGVTRREAEILAWVVEGKTNPTIATILGISARTVQHHLEHIYRKLDVENRSAAVARVLTVPPART